MSRARTFADLASASEAGSLATANILINGDCAIAQRSTSSTSTGYQTVDRLFLGVGQVSVTQSQQALTSGSPYEAGFNNFYRMANTSTSSNAGSYVQVNHSIEAQHIANSGWNFKSSSSFVTVSFWARSSLAGTYYVRINTDDGTTYYRIKAFALSADTWTKVTFTIEGNSNLTINDDNGVGLQVVIVPHYGTTYTGSNASTTAWFTLTSNDYFPDYAQNWGNTSSATFDVTGLQLEVGQVATPYKFESYGDNLARCQRYFYVHASGDNDPIGSGVAEAAAASGWFAHFPVSMRTEPSLEVVEGTDYYQTFGGGATDNFTGMLLADVSEVAAYLYNNSGKGAGGNTAGRGILAVTNNASSKVSFSAEL